MSPFSERKNMIHLFPQDLNPAVHAFFEMIVAGVHSLQSMKYHRITVKQTSNIVQMLCKGIRPLHHTAIRGIELPGD
jgi:hypothetical protein